MSNPPQQALYLVTTDTHRPNTKQPAAPAGPGDVSACGDAANLGALLTQVVEHNNSALEQLYLATVDTVFGLTSKILGVGPDAEEVTEDVYLYVWHNAHRFDASQGHPMAWLVMLARSRAIDRYRHRARVQRLDSELQQESQAHAETEEAEPLSLLLDRKLQQWLQALPTVQRQIISMAYFRGMTHAEIAAGLNMSLGTVKTHIRRTLLALREAVNQDDPLRSEQDDTKS